MTPAAQVEALLFQQAEPLTINRLAKLLNLPTTVINEALIELEFKLKDRGLALIKSGEEVTLGTKPEAASFLAELAKQELSGPLGKAGLETLAIILYHAPITRPEVDYIRGVNSSFIVRHLLVRGLIKRSVKPGDARAFIYEPTLEALAHLGVSQREALPRFHEITKLTTESLQTLTTNE
ncbi:MAG: SMC-Scp complex subunit ScpB [bacterium]|nr:SMC-Scp complex subunit ScpB [bacterium]